MKGMRVIFFVMILGLVVTVMWDKLPVVKELIHFILDPSFGRLMHFNLNLGFVLIVCFFTLITMLLQKYVTDQDTLKRIKEEQKLVQQEIKLYRSNPDKSMELSKKSMELTMKAMPITMKPVMYTTIPFLLTIRWFGDYFESATGKLLYVFTPSKTALFPQWIWAYILVSLALTLILRKILKIQ